MFPFLRGTINSILLYNMKYTKLHVHDKQKDFCCWFFNLSVYLLYRFMVNRRIFVVGFGLYGSIHGPKEYYVTIQVYTFCTCTNNDVHFFFCTCKIYIIPSIWLVENVTHDTLHLHESIKYNNAATTATSVLKLFFEVTIQMNKIL